ncbi:hypothetical protein CSKR_103589 [Clonorchis sinensis]|uniref:Uncharacterized protein n=1 Tax=Clonorchis sinensis TaxID=79923 RepID=A0A3R7CZH1_CLOSI|nr:hypothetical protein CSKR_103589 [Clonorchis sinensis]
MVVMMVNRITRAVVTTNLALCLLRIYRLVLKETLGSTGRLQPSAVQDPAATFTPAFRDPVGRRAYWRRSWSLGPYLQLPVLTANQPSDSFSLVRHLLVNPYSPPATATSPVAPRLILVPDTLAPPSSGRQLQVDPKHWPRNFDELVRQQPLSLHSIQSRKGTIQLLLQTGEQHRRTTPWFYAGRLKPSHDYLAVSRCIELRCKGFSRVGPFHHPGPLLATSRAAFVWPFRRACIDIE